MLHALLAFLTFGTPRCDLVVETFDGQVYVVGSGDTCSDAMANRAPWPDNWREIRFERN